MAKVKKTSEKRRSPSRLVRKSGIILPYGEVVGYLPKLFTLFEQDKKFNITNDFLKDDIKALIKIVEKFEKEDCRSYRARTSKGYNSKDVDKLSAIMKQFNYCVGIESYNILLHSVRNEQAWQSKKVEESDWVRHYVHRMDEILESLKKISKKRVQKLRFYSIEEPREINSDTQWARYLLQQGLFDYLQRLINGDRYRPRRCAWCRAWFPASQSNKETCSSMCKEKHYVKNKGGAVKRRRNTRKYRKR